MSTTALKPFSFNVTIQAASEQDAISKLKAAKTLATVLSTEDIILFAKTAQEKPQKIKMAKNFL
jgi:hypothetical protein